MSRESADPPADGTSQRSDARRNRERLLTEARALFGRRGIDASLEEVAARAGVGIATLYRNFPTRDDLVRALYDQYIGELDDLIAEASAAATGWDGIEVYVRGVAEWMIADPSIQPTTQRMGLVAPDYRPADHMIEPVALVVRRAHDEGSLRADVNGVDLGIVAAMLGTLGQYGSAYAPYWRRQLAIVLDGLRAATGAATPLPVEPQDIESFHRMMHGADDPAD